MDKDTIFLEKRISLWLRNSDIDYLNHIITSHSKNKRIKYNQSDVIRMLIDICSDLYGENIDLTDENVIKKIIKEFKDGL